MHKAGLLYASLLLISSTWQTSCNPKKSTRNVNIESHTGKAYYALLFDQKDIHALNFEVGDLIIDDSHLNDEFTFTETATGHVLETGSFSEGLKQGLWKYTYMLNNKQYGMQVDWEVSDEIEGLELSLPKGWGGFPGKHEFFKARSPDGEGKLADSVFIGITRFGLDSCGSIDSFFRQRTSNYLGSGELDRADHYKIEQDSSTSYYSFYMFKAEGKRICKFVYQCRTRDACWEIVYTNHRRNYSEDRIRFFEIIRNTRIDGNKLLEYICHSMSFEVIPASSIKKPGMTNSKA